MPTKIIGTAPYQVPRNSDLGTLAVQDLDNVSIQGGAVALGASATQGYFQNTDVSEVKPSLLLDFANGKTLDPRIIYNRASTGVYYDGKTVAKAEENLLPYSTTPVNGYGNWMAQNPKTILNAAVAPDLTITACALNPSTASAYQYIHSGNNVATFPTGTATMSVYVKANGFTKVGLREGQTSSACVAFDLTAGTILSSAANSSTGITGAITYIGNGWYRISATCTGVTAQRLELWVLSNSFTTGDVVSNASGDGNTGIYYWGPQIEHRAFTTPYTPTTSNVVTNWIPQLLTANIGSPRFDHDPVTGESKGLLVETARTNLFTYSSSYDNAAWSKNNVSVWTDISTVAPNGTNSAQKIVASTSTVGHYVYYPISNASTNTVYTYSIYLKAAGINFVNVDMSDNTTGDAAITVDLSSGTIANTGQSGVWTTVSGSVTPVGNGWYRCTVTGTKGANGTMLYPYITLMADKQTGTFAGDGYSGVYAWGAQLEQGWVATSYVATTAAQVTRAADIATIYDSMFASSEGTVYVDATATGALGTNMFSGLVAITGTDYTNVALSVGLNNNTSQVQNEQYTYASGRAFFYYNVSSRSVRNAFSYNATSAQGVVYATPSLLTNSTTTTMPVSPIVDRMRIGTERTGNANLNGTVKKIAFYQKALSAAELSEIVL